MTEQGSKADLAVTADDRLASSRPASPSRKLRLPVVSQQRLEACLRLIDQLSEEVVVADQQLNVARRLPRARQPGHQRADP